MKRFCIVLIVLLMCGCSSKTISYEERSEKYAELQSQIQETVNNTDTFLAVDYKDSIAKISEDLDQLVAGLSEEDEAIAESLFTQASRLKAAAGLFSNDQASAVISLADDVLALVRSAYDKADGFNELKEKIGNELTGFASWSDADWRKIEKRPLISWSEVEEEYEILAQETIDNLVRPRDVSEAQLEEYKDTILNNYELIADGVSEDNKDNADVIYEAAVALHEYTYEMNNVSADKVARFAAGAIDYVKRCYGADIPDEYDFANSVTAAERWPLSLWNELTTLMKKR